MAVSHSNVLRAAYDTLRDPIKRASALLVWRYDAEGVDEHSEIEDQDFLMEVLEGTNRNAYIPFVHTYSFSLILTHVYFVQQMRRSTPLLRSKT